MQILIVEEALHSGKGHWPGYIGGIAGGMRAAGDDVEVLTHREASTRVLADVGGTPWFSKNCWVDTGSQGAWGGIRHNFNFRSELADWLHSHSPYDWVCALTMRLQHLLAFALLSRGRMLPGSTRFLLLFVQGFGQYSGAGRPTSFPSSGSTQLARLCFRLLAPAVRSGRVVLAAETEGMQDELQRFTNMPVVLFPHPVPPPRSSDNRPLTSDNRITITCPGFARHEKGNDLLQEAAKRMLAGSGSDNLRFVFQWPEPFEMPDGTQLGPDPVLFEDPRVEFLNRNLDAEAYETLLARTDLVVLPYRRNSYHHRVSRVAIEAAARGIPLVYTHGTWSGEVAALAGGGVEIWDETAEGVATALRKALAELPALRASAWSGASPVASFHSNETFRSLLATPSQPS
jgi:glycosyltransferase involved in cell wall biosynthesis